MDNEIKDQYNRIIGVMDKIITTQKSTIEILQNIVAKLEMRVALLENKPTQKGACA